MGENSQNMSDDQVNKILAQIKTSETSVTEKITSLEQKFDTALREQEERHALEIGRLRTDFENKHSALATELDSIRQLIEGRSENIKLSNNAVETAVKEVASAEYKKLQTQVLHSNEKANANEQYTRNWCLRVYGVKVGKEEVDKVGHTRATMDAVYNSVFAPILRKVIDNGNCEFDDLPKASDIIENCHTLGKEFKGRDGKTLPPAIIVRFLKRDIRDLIIRNRKLAPKPSQSYIAAGIDKFKLVEDLTKVNYARLQDLIKDKRVDKVWSIQGKFRIILADDPQKKVIKCQGTLVDVNSLVDTMKEK